MKPAHKYIQRFVILMLSAWLALTVSGCSSRTASSSDDASFISQITAAYPELKSKPHTVDRVKRVVDGDTFETESGQKVRLIGINTPESIGQVEYYGKEASNYSRERLTGKKVYMFQDTGDTDKYGRLLRYIFIENEKTMYNETLVAEGFANPMTVPPNVMFSKKFVEREREARAGNKGLWGKEAKDTKNTKETTDSQNNTKSGKCANPKIKGNINAKNEKIFHIPGGRYYDDTQAEEMFCTEEEAAAAGYRKAKD